VDTLGRKSIQIVGFFILTGLFCVIGFAYNILNSGALLALYILAQLFFNFGPNTTTFIIPGECFPTRYRSTGHGLSAAFGKIGAIVVQVMAPSLLGKEAPDSCKGTACQPWLNHLMQIFALFMLCGTLVSFLVPETKGRTLEELAGELPDEQRNGSVTTRGEKRSWWCEYSPFRGGKPAGFNSGRSPNLLPRSPGIRGKRARVGIMMSPDLLPKKGEKGKITNAKATSFESGSGDAYSVSSNGRQMDADDDAYLSGAAGGVLPGWSAGWGVQRGPRRDERVESIMLHDVGSLLK
jgi:MFS transporter, PHS family, inorganic phosphate transporter